MPDVLFLMLGGFGVICLGLYFIFGGHGPKPGMIPVEAVIVDHSVERSSSDGHGTHTTSFPIYEYRVNGKTYRYRGSVGITIFSKEKYRIGAVHTGAVKPEKPGRLYTEEEKRSTAGIGVFLVIFGLVFVLGSATGL